MQPSSPSSIALSIWVSRCIALFAMIIFSGHSLAGIAEFNAAMRAGDYVAAAGETAATWEDYDKSQDSAVTIAREFAFVNYLAGDFESAATFIDILVGTDGAMTERDDQPATSRLLAGLVHWRMDNSDENRRALLQRLQERAAEPSVDNISLLAAEELYNDDWVQGRSAEVGESSALAIELFERTEGQYLVQKRRAEVIAAAADFLVSRNESSYPRFGEIHNAIVSDVDGDIDESQRQALIPLKWIAQAWSSAVWAYFDTTYRKVGRYNDLDGPELQRSAYGHFYENSNVGETQKPLCDYRIAGRVNYPSSAAFRGLVGSVVFKMDYDEEGRGSNMSILAAVPAGNFGDSVLRAQSRLRLEALEGQDTDACRLQRKDQIGVVRFAIQ